jgi:hypothetical protein
MIRRLSPLLGLSGLAVLIIVTVVVAPSERTLGSNVRIVYLHGAWVWTALIAFAASGSFALLGLLTRWRRALAISEAAAKTATVFWVTYLPLSLWAMQANWNGLFLQEPRWRLGLDFAIIGLLAQVAILLIDRRPFAAAVNLAFPILLFLQLSRAEAVMHPNSPIFPSGAGSIQVFFLLLTALCLTAAWQLTRWFWRPFQPTRA